MVETEALDISTLKFIKSCSSNKNLKTGFIQQIGEFLKLSPPGGFRPLFRSSLRLVYTGLFLIQFEYMATWGQKDRHISAVGR